MSRNMLRMERYEACVATMMIVILSLGFSWRRSSNRHIVKILSARTPTRGIRTYIQPSATPELFCCVRVQPAVAQE